MKPTRSLSGTWGALPRERKTALVSLALLLSMLGSLMAYQRFVLERSQTPQAEAAANVSGGAASPAPGAAHGAEAAEAKPAAGTVQARTVDLIGKMVRPLAGVHTVLKPFARVDQTFGDVRLFGGMAYQARMGESVQAAAAGTVADISESDPLEGVVVTVDHGGGLMTRYAGLGKVLVTKGSQVQPGTILGQIGTPGPAHAALGTHLEFQVLKNGQAEDPTVYFPAE